MRICRVATVPFSLQHHLYEQIRATISAGHEVTLISSPGPQVTALRDLCGGRFVLIDIPRTVSPWRDLRALWQLFRAFRKHRFDIVHSITPKAGLLCALAARGAGVPVRLHTFTGQPWVELRGTMRWIARTCDKLMARLNTMNYADSHSQRDFLVEEGLVTIEKIAVPGGGSLAGVDTRRFDRTQWQEKAQGVRQQLGISGTARVITFIGRLTRDKGIVELVVAFSQITSRHSDCVLLLVGPEEPERDPLPEATLSAIRSNPQIRAIGYSSEPEKYLAVSDLFCLPSYREGFGNVVIEAAAMGVPTVGTEIIGLSDAVVHGTTGLLVPPKDIDALAAALQQLIEDADLRRDLGINARNRAIREFDARQVNAHVLAEYERIATRGRA